MPEAGLNHLPAEPFLEWLRKHVNRHGADYVIRRTGLPKRQLFKYISGGRTNAFNIDFVDRVLITEETHIWQLYPQYFDD